MRKFSIDTATSTQLHSTSYSTGLSTPRETLHDSLHSIPQSSIHDIILEKRREVGELKVELAERTARYGQAMQNVKRSFKQLKSEYQERMGELRGVEGLLRMCEQRQPLRVRGV